MAQINKISPTPPEFLRSRWANTIRYSLMNLFIIGGAVTIALGGWWMWAGLFLSFLIAGLFEELVGDAGDDEKLPPTWYLNLMLFITWPLLLAITIICLNIIGSGFDFIDQALISIGFDPVTARNNTGFFTASGGLVSVGMFYGLSGVNVAHELVHRTKSRFSMILGRWLLAFTWDTGFAIEHVYGHHRHVGTRNDPATARRGEILWFFIIRSTIGQIISAIKFENARLKRRNIPNNIFTNIYWRGQLMSVVVILLYVSMVGPIGILYSAFSAAVGKIYLEAVNYIEHYGLVRIEGQPIQERHSWDSHRRISTGMTYNLPLHSSHHRFASRPFWKLQHASGKAPVLPMGYMPMIFCSAWPPYWKKISEPLLKNWDQNLASPQERKYLADIGELRT